MVNRLLQMRIREIATQLALLYLKSNSWNWRCFCTPFPLDNAAIISSATILPSFALLAPINRKSDFLVVKSPAPRGYQLLHKFGLLVFNMGQTDLVDMAGKQAKKQANINY